LGSATAQTVATPAEALRLRLVADNVGDHAKYKIAWMPGDELAHDVMEAARLVLDV